MRVLVGALVLAAALSLRATPADASCAPPASLADNAARAEAVAYGTVTDASGGAATLRVDRVLKGSVAASVRFFTGPGRSGGATSVDYQAGVGGDNVVYLVRGADGELETSACIGSHAGPPTAEEAAFFGTTGSPAPATPAGVSAPEGAISAPSTQTPATAWAALALVAALALGGLLLGRRRGTAS